MSYASISQVKSLFRQLIDTADAAVSDAEITVFLDNNSAYIDSRLNDLYLLPILVGTSPESFKILSQINMFFTAAIIDDILNSYGNDQKKPQWGRMASDMLDNIAPKKDSKGKQPDPNNKLVDANYLGTATQKGKFKLSSTDTTIFKKGVDTW